MIQTNITSCIELQSDSYIECMIQCMNYRTQTLKALTLTKPNEMHCVYVDLDANASLWLTQKSRSNIYLLLASFC